jgi:hypothetical protein
MARWVMMAVIPGGEGTRRGWCGGAFRSRRVQPGLEVRGGVLMTMPVALMAAGPAAIVAVEVPGGGARSR